MFDRKPGGGHPSGGSLATGHAWRTQTFSDEALVRFGENCAHRSLSLSGALREYANSGDRHGQGGGCRNLERAGIVARGWQLAATADAVADPCTDSETGLATMGYLRGRLAELYQTGRATGVDSMQAFTLIVVSPTVDRHHDAAQRCGGTSGNGPKAPEPTDLRQALSVLLPLFSEAETTVRCGSSSIVILQRSDHDGVTALLRATRAALATACIPNWRVWTERPAPVPGFSAAQLREIVIAAEPISEETLPNSQVHQRPAPRNEASERISEIVSQHARQLHDCEVSFETALAALILARDSLELRHARQLDDPWLIAALAEPWGRSSRTKSAGIADPITGYKSREFYRRRLQEIVHRRSHSPGESSAGAARLLLRLRRDLDPTDLVGKLRLAGALQRIFQSGETLAQTSTRTISVVGFAPDRGESLIARLDALCQHQWAREQLESVRSVALSDLDVLGPALE